LRMVEARDFFATQNCKIILMRVYFIDLFLLQFPFWDFRIIDQVIINSIVEVVRHGRQRRRKKDPSLWITLPTPQSESQIHAMGRVVYDEWVWAVSLNHPAKEEEGTLSDQTPLNWFLMMFVTYHFWQNWLFSIDGIIKVHVEQSMKPKIILNRSLKGMEMIFHHNSFVLREKKDHFFFWHRFVFLLAGFQLLSLSLNSSRISVAVFYEQQHR